MIQSYIPHNVIGLNTVVDHKLHRAIISLLPSVYDLPYVVTVYDRPITLGIAQDAPLTSGRVYDKPRTL